VKERVMPCPHCPATETTEQSRPIALGYRTFRCGRCRRVCNERTGTAFNHRQCPTDLVFLVVLWRLRDTLRLRDLSEMFLVRGFVFSHEAVRDWEARFGALLTAWLRAKRRGGGTTKWHAGETSLRVGGRWCSLYRAIDRDGNRIEALLSEQRAMDAAQRFFAGALAVAGHAPERVTTDGHDAYPRAVRETLGPGVQHRTSRSKNTRIAQDHRGIKRRYSPLRGFGTFDSAARFSPPSKSSATTSGRWSGRARPSRSRIGGACCRTAGQRSWPSSPPDRRRQLASGHPGRSPTTRCRPSPDATPFIRGRR